MDLHGFVTFSCIVLIIITAQVTGCDERNCVASNGSVCNEHGTCDCGVCKCEGSYSGPTCEECPTCPSPCEIYKNCVGCKIFGTGTLGTMECIIQCDYIATFLPVDKIEFDKPDDGDDRILCRTLNKAYCMESFKIGGMREGYRDLYVRTEEDCNAKYIPTNPPIIEVTLDTGNGRKEKPEDAGAVSGTNQGQKVDDNGSEMRTVSSFLVLAVIMVSFVL